MARRKGRAPNASRRLGDRAWTGDGVELERVVNDEYFEAPSAVREFVQRGPVLVGVLRDHAGIEWLPEGAASRALALMSGSEPPVALSNGLFGATFWLGLRGGQPRVVLLEEVH